jgi:hypothetical protein
MPGVAGEDLLELRTCWSYGLRSCAGPRLGSIRCSPIPARRRRLRPSWTACSAQSGARPAGCGRRRPATRGHAFVNRRLYLSRDWTDKPERHARTHVPEAVRFATKPQLAVGMITRAIAAGIPFAWVAADSIYGVGKLEMALRRAGKGYVLGVTGVHHFNS